MARKEIPVETRQVLGKKVAQLRRSGILPGNVFGSGIESVAVQAPTEAIEKTLKTLAANEVIDLKIGGESSTRPVVIQKVQRHPLTSGLVHLDFYQVSLRQKMRADVPLVVIGKSEGVDTYNGVLVQALEVLHVEALPLDLPSRIEVDITPLANLEDTLHVSDLPIPGNVTVLTDAEVVVVKVASPRVSAEEEEEGVEAAEAPEAAAEGEEAPAAGGEGESEGEEA
ncbi:MAG TPA: 50S ribosomal protein L25 [Dehalococcoidia bacterium]|nr:50S ribosomal protein L25 [Dehalococcoidia bacterium]